MPFHCSVITTNYSIKLKMSNFVTAKQHLWEVLLHYFILKKSAAENYRLFVEANSDQRYLCSDKSLSARSCREWFRRFKDSNYDMKDKERSDVPKKIEVAEFETLLNEDLHQILKELSRSLNVDELTVISKRLKAIGFIHKQDYWVATCFARQRS